MLKMVKYIGVAVVAVMLLAMVALVLLVNPVGETWVKGWLEGKLTTEVGLPVTIAEFETNLVSRVQVRQLLLRSDTTASADSLVYLSHLRLRYSILDLLGSDIHLKAVVADSIDMRLAFDSLGHSGIAALDSPVVETPEEAGEPMSFHADTISLGSFQAGLVDQRLPLTLRLFGASVRLQGAASRQYSGILGVDSLCGKYNSIPLCVADLRVAASWEEDTITITSATASVAGLQWRAEGTIAGAQFDEMAVTTSLEGDPGLLLPVVRARLDQPDIGLDSIALMATVGGTMDAPLAQVRCNARQLRYGPIEVPSSSVHARYVPDSLVIDSFLMTVFDGTISGNGYVLTDTTRAADLSFKIDRINIAPVWRTIYSETSPYHGKLRADIHISGSGERLSGWSAAAEAHASGLRYRDRGIPDLVIQASLTDEVADLSFKHGPNAVAASLIARADTLNGSFRLDLPDISSLAALINQPELTGQLQAFGSIAGAVENPSMRAFIDGSRLSYRNFPIDSIHAEAGYADSALTITEFFCQGQFDEIPAGQEIFDIDSLNAALDYRCDLKGPLDSLSGSMHVDLSHLQYSTYSVDSAAVQASLEDGRVELSMLDIYHDDLLLHGSGHIDTTTRCGAGRVEVFEISETVSAIDSLTIGTAVQVISRGVITSSFEYTDDAVLAGEVSGRDIWAGLINNLTSDSTVTGGLADFDLTFAGPLPTPDADLTAVVRGVDVGDFAIDSVVMSSAFTVNRFTLESLQVTALQQSINISGGIVLESTGDGTVTAGDSTTIYGQARIDDFDLAILEPFLAPEGNVSGAVSASIDMTGSLSSPHVTGWLTATDGLIQLTQASIPVEQLHVALSLADSILVIDTAVCMIDEMAAMAEGSIVSHQFELFDASLVLTLRNIGSLTSSGWFSRDSLALEVRGDGVDISVFQPFLVGIDSLEGTLSTDVRIAGSLDLPVITGSLAVADLSLNAPEHFTSVRRGQAALSFDEKHVNIDSLQMAVNGGSVTMSGGVTHEAGVITNIDLQLQASDVLLREPEVYSATVRRADLTYGRQEDLYVIDGDIELGETRLTARFRPQSILPWAQAAETVDWELPELIARSRLDVRLKESHDLWVDNNLARIRMHAAVGVVGTPVRPNLSGRISIDEGYLLYLDRRFRVNEGTVYFTDPTRFNPDILLDASTQVTSYRRTSPVTYKVFIRAEGLMDKLQVALYSEPPLDKPDIVALLTLGATRTDLAGKGDAEGSGGLKNVLTDRAAMLTSRRISNYVATKAGSAFGFDEFTIQGNLFQFNESWGPQLVASRRLSERVNMTYTTRVGHLNDQSIQLGYRLTPRLSLQSETDSFGRAGFDLKYGFRFR